MYVDNRLDNWSVAQHVTKRPINVKTVRTCWYELEPILADF